MDDRLISTLSDLIYSQAVEALKELLPDAFDAAFKTYLDTLGLDDLSARLLAVPEELAAKRRDRADFARLLGQTKEDLDMANLPLEAEAYANGKNAELRKSALLAAQAKDPNYQTALSHMRSVQSDLDMIDVDIRTLDDRFAALRTVARLKAAELEYLSH
jgi:hypothetical protein